MSPVDWIVVYVVQNAAQGCESFIACLKCLKQLGFLDDLSLARVSSPQSRVMLLLPLTALAGFASAEPRASSSLSLITSYPADQSSRLAALSTACVSQIRNCPLNQLQCATPICSICTNLGILPPIEQCCHAATPTKCFENNYIHGVTTSAASVPPLSLASTVLAGAVACKSLYSIYHSCEAATPG